MDNYTIHKTLQGFHDSPAFYRGVKGPVGSGKSTAMCFEVMMKAGDQRPNKDGIRKTRWAIIRNTYRELEDTTLKTWLHCFPEEKYGDFNQHHMTHHIKGPTTDVEVMFRALDRPGDIKKLLSLELTGGWINEAREVPKGVVDALGDRVGRYPAEDDGGPTWHGVIMDTNAPDDDHWWYKLAEEDTPEDWEFWNQPGGLIETSDGVFADNPAAENVANLPSRNGKSYYQTRIGGKTKAYIKIYYCNEYGFVQDGKPVYGDYFDHVHCFNRAIDGDPSGKLYIGIDFGLTPAAVFGQRTVTGRWLWIDELVTEDMGAARFGELLGQKIRDEYRGYSTEIYGDPAGDQRAQTDERTPFQILAAKGIDAMPAPSNDIVLRREAVSQPMRRLIDGHPGFLISPKCKITRKGLAGGFHYRRVQMAGVERYHDRPEKNKYSHPCEAGEYLMLGAGEGLSLITPAHDEDDYDEDWMRDDHRSATTGY